ncbi:MAG TPA: response regulator [Flavisolibacter sp.]|nr:response regulator [Flavisolibacter sp.]
MPKKIKVLLVEDNDDERLFMKEGFTQSGLYEVVAEAENGSEMLKLFEASTFSYPELVVSDLNMPVRNGYELILDIKTNSTLSHIPVVILTTAPLVPYAERCRRIGACAYYTKPDTFLEYDVFAASIYDDVVRKCLAQH